MSRDPARRTGVLTLLAAALAAIANIAALRSGQDALAFQVHGPAGRPAGRASAATPTISATEKATAAPATPSTASAARPPSASSSATASGCSCSATSSCSAPSSPPTPCCMTGPPAARPATTCSTPATSRSRPGACCCPASPAAWPASASRSVVPRGSTAPWPRPSGWGTAFIGLEFTEFVGLIAHGNGPGRSAFLSAFFALVGLHGVHVSAGLLWLLTMMAQVWPRGSAPTSCAGSCASACSGTRSTSSGSACSRSSTWWEWRHETPCVNVLGHSSLPCRHVRRPGRFAPAMPPVAFGAP